MFGKFATILVVAASAASVFAAPTEATVQKRTVVPSDYLTPHNAARAATGAAYVSSLTSIRLIFAYTYQPTCLFS